jgi:hypothetical protein
MTGVGVDPRRPVLVGWAAVAQSQDDPAAALEAVALMTKAARLAGQRAGSRELLGAIERVYVPTGRWSYRNPGAAIAAGIGASRATSVLSPRSACCSRP